MENCGRDGWIEEPFWGPSYRGVFSRDWRVSPYFLIPMKGQTRDGCKNYLCIMIGSFDFYPIGGKGQLTEPVNTCFLHLAPDETSTVAFWLAPSHTACDFYSIAGRGDSRALWDFKLLTTFMTLLIEFLTAWMRYPFESLESVWFIVVKPWFFRLWHCLLKFCWVHCWCWIWCMW